MLGYASAKNFRHSSGGSDLNQESSVTASDPPGLWLVNGTIGIHQALRVTLESNNIADDGQAVDYDYLLEAM